MSFEKKPIWFIVATTGCTCCSYENFTAGPFLTKEDAEKQVAFYRDTRRLASQYAESGRYWLREEEGEFLPDGRIICDGSIYASIGEERMS